MKSFGQPQVQTVIFPWYGLGNIGDNLLGDVKNVLVL